MRLLSHPDNTSYMVNFLYITSCVKYNSEIGLGLIKESKPEKEEVEDFDRLPFPFLALFLQYRPVQQTSLQQINL